MGFGKTGLQTHHHLRGIQPVHVHFGQVRQGAAQALVKDDFPQQAVNRLAHHCFGKIGRPHIRRDALPGRPGDDFLGKSRRNPELGDERALHGRFERRDGFGQPVNEIIGVWLNQVELPVFVQGHQISGQFLGQVGQCQALRGRQRVAGTRKHLHRRITAQHFALLIVAAGRGLDDGLALVGKDKITHLARSGAAGHELHQPGGLKRIFWRGQPQNGERLLPKLDAQHRQPARKPRSGSRHQRLGGF